MARRNLKTAVRREQIARAALGLVAAGGPKALRMSALARHVGIAPSAIYRHFPNKEQVLLAALDLFRASVLDNVRAVREETPDALERLRRLLLRQVRLIPRSAMMMPRMAFADDSPGVAATGRDRVAAVLGEFLKAVADIVREGQRRGEIRRDASADAIALMVFGLIQPAGILWHLRRGRFNIPRQVAVGWRVLRSGLEA